MFSLNCDKRAWNPRYRNLQSRVMKKGSEFHMFCRYDQFHRCVSDMKIDFFFSNAWNFEFDFDRPWYLSIAVFNL